MVNNKYGYLKGIQLAGEDQQFYFAMALIKDDQVVISGNKVHKPVVARFAWSNNPEDANLFKAVKFIIKIIISLLKSSSLYALYDIIAPSVFSSHLYLKQRIKMISNFSNLFH